MIVLPVMDGPKDDGMYHLHPVVRDGFLKLTPLVDSISPQGRDSRKGG